MKKNLNSTLLFALIIAGLAIGVLSYFLGTRSVLQPTSPPTTPSPAEELLLTERAQMLATARKYVEANSVDVEFDLEIAKLAGDWALLNIIPRYEETDVAAMIMERVDHRWQVRAMGTILPGWKEKVPELFE